MADSASIHRLPAETASVDSGPAAPLRRDGVRELRKPAPEGESPAAPKPAPTADETAHAPVTKLPAKRTKRGWKRPLLFALPPLALIAGGYFYATGGQITSTDNAY